MGRPRLINIRICSECGSENTYLWINKKGYRNFKWYLCNGRVLCHKCRNKIKIIFRGKAVYLKENPRNGVCSECNKKIGDPFTNNIGKPVKIKRTHLHHDEYNSDDVLEHTRELCASCHGKKRSIT